MGLVEFPEHEALGNSTPSSSDGGGGGCLSGRVVRVQYKVKIAGYHGMYIVWDGEECKKFCGFFLYMIGSRGGKIDVDYLERESRGGGGRGVKCE